MNEHLPGYGIEILSAVEAVCAEVRALRMELIVQRTNNKTPRQVRTEKRHKSLRELADATGMGRGWPCASEIVLILAGKRPAPPGFESLVQGLRRDDECPHSLRGMYRVISSAN